MDQCSVDECDRDRYCKGLCTKHYQRLRNYGHPTEGGPATRRQRGTPPPSCQQDGCSRPVSSRGWCELHYRRWLHNGGPESFAPRPDPTPAQLAALAEGRTRPRDRMSDEERLRRGRESSRECMRRRRAADPELMRQKRRDHMNSYGPEYRRKWNNYNRLRRAEVAGQFDADGIEWLQIIAADPCAYCGAEMQHADHIDPVALGGTNAWDNFTAACAPCNQSKSAKPLLTFLMDRMVRDGS